MHLYQANARTLNVIDDYNREAFIVKVSLTLPACRIVEHLDNIAQKRGYPMKIRIDNGPENISNIMEEWAQRKNIKLEL